MVALKKYLPVGLLLLLVWTGSALATVRTSPVSFRTESALVPFQDGESQLLVMRMIVRYPAVVTDIQLTGQNWTVSPVTRILKQTQEPLEVYRLEAEVSTTDADQPLKFSYRLDGEPKARLIDLSESKLLGLKTQGKTVSDPSSENIKYQINGAVDLPIKPAPVDPRHLLHPGSAGIAPGEDPAVAAVARSLKVTGRFGYYAWGSYRPAWGVTVHLFADTWPQDTLLGAGVVQSDGYFLAQGIWLLDWVDPDVYLVFRAANDIVRVTPHTDDDPNSYSWRSDTYTMEGTELYIGSEIPEYVRAPALNVMGSIVRANAWWYNFGGYTNVPRIHAMWPNTGSGCFYRVEGDYIEDREYQIVISRASEWDEVVAGHEYGHHFVFLYGSYRSPEYCNYICDDNVSNDDCGHCNWCEEDRFIAFSEGFPNWMGDAIVRDWRTRYGFEPISLIENYHDYESNHPCTETGHVGLGDVWITEGPFTALLRDIDDSTNDWDPKYPGYGDKLDLHPSAILQIVDIDGPTTVEGFMQFFEARHPSRLKEFWETCANNGYRGRDSEPPVTSALTSPTHTPYGSSKNNHVTVEWDPIADDYSGVGGFSVTANQNMILLPDTIKEPILTTAQSYTFENLEPGDWHFAIRAMDREGNWDPNYESFGPVTIVPPDPGDLRPEGRTDSWAYPLVVKDTPTATQVVVTVDVLPLLSTTYWNAGLVNYGEAATLSAEAQIRIDGQFHDWFSIPSLVGTQSFSVQNQGPTSMDGGRHTFELVVDNLGEVAEPNEDDNRYAHQWIWAPDRLDYGTVHTLGPPPKWDGGMAAVTDQLFWFNCDGLDLVTLDGARPSPWVVLAAHAESNADNLELQLHDSPTGAEAGFDHLTLLANSLRPAGYLDAVVVNAANRPAQQYAVGALSLDEGGMAGGYLAQIEYGELWPPGFDCPGTLERDEGVALYTFPLTTAMPIQLTLQLDVTVNAPTVYAAWYDQSFDVGGLLNHDAVGVTDYNGTITLDFNAEAGEHAVIIWRDPVDAEFAPLGYTLSFGPPPPDLLHFQPAGWDYPIIPATTKTVTPTNGPEPTALYGETGTTYLNLALENGSPSGVGSFYVGANVDGELVQEDLLGPQVGNFNATILPSTPIVVPGGRHMLSMKVDQREMRYEQDEVNNTWATQYIWSPSTLGINHVYWRPNPPDPTADWDRVKTSEIVYYNCDGVATPTFVPAGNTGHWGAVGILPRQHSDVNLSLYERHTGVRSGFDIPLAESTWPLAQTDFVLMNFRNTALRQFEAGMVLGQSTMDETYFITMRQTASGGTDPNGVIGSYSFSASQFLDLYEFQFTTPGNYRVTLDIAEPTLDLGMTLYGPDQEYYAKNDVFEANCAAWTESAGVSESFAFTIDAGQEGHYCLAVWKVGNADAQIAGSYTLSVEEELALTELLPHTPPGWAAPVSPRPTQDATRTWSPLPDAIPGDAATYFNYSARSDPSVVDPGPCEFDIYLDGANVVAYNFPGASSGGQWYWLDTSPEWVPGGRHTIGFMVDVGNRLPEIDETNNTYGAQYVWTPKTLALNTPDYRTQLWPHWEGHTYIADGSVLWPNADGVRTPIFQPEVTYGYWGCVALLCDDTAEVDLDLHEISTGFEDGFTIPLVSSDWPPGHSEFVLMNFNTDSRRQFDAGIVSHTDDEEENMVVVTESNYFGPIPNGTMGSYWLKPDELVDLFEFYLDTQGGYQVTVTGLDSRCDLGVSFYGPDAPFYDKSDAFDDGINGRAISFTNPPGQSEIIDFVIDTPGYYAVAVWKAQSVDYGDSSVYRLDFTLDFVTGVKEEESVPALTRLTGVYPNPFNPMTTVAFELNSAQVVRLEIFDVRGRLVRVLANEALPAGSHERIWRGIDGSGKNVSSGVYMIRMTAGETVELKRVSLLK